jgi:pimeloyl-ACP methyl ester carboxylesterase
VSSDLWLAEREPMTDADPSRPIAVFVHGSMDRSASFIRAIRELPEFHAVRYDRRGYGRSVGARIGEGTTLLEHARDLLAIVDGRRAVLVGHSIGGDVALAAASAAGASIAGVVAYEAPMRWVSWWPSNSAGSDAMHGDAADGPEQAAERFLRRMIGDARWEGLSDATQAARRAEGWALTSELRSLREGAPYDVGRLTMPVVCGRGSDSKAHHRRAAAELAEAVPAGELVEIAGAEHGAHSSHPEAFADLVRRAARG